MQKKKKLRHYFETHPINIITDFPIKQILSKPDLSGRLTKWAIDLGVYDIHYVPRAAKKGQFMADFLIEIQSFSAELEQFLHTKKSSKCGYLAQMELQIPLVKGLEMCWSLLHN